jgi:hypothetical protein
MRPNTLLIAAIVCVANAGCGTFWENTCRNLTEAPIYGVNECRVSARNERLARQAWKAACRANAGEAYSTDFGEGFRDGFADYLEEGGNGQPPAVPPFRYRLARYQTPEGYRAIEDWYAGFRAGAEAAHDSGLREVFVLPLSAPPINAVQGRPGAGGILPPAEPAPDLPPPHVVEPIPPPDAAEPADPPSQVSPLQGGPPGERGADLPSVPARDE